MTETRIYRPKGSIYFQSYTDSELVNMPKCFPIVFTW